MSDSNAGASSSLHRLRTTNRLRPPQKFGPRTAQPYRGPLVARVLDVPPVGTRCACPTLTRVRHPRCISSASARRKSLRPRTHQKHSPSSPTDDQDDGAMSADLAEIYLSALWDHAAVSGRPFPLWWTIPGQGAHIGCRRDRFPALGFIRRLTGDQTAGQNGEERPLNDARERLH